MRRKKFKKLILILIMAIGFINPMAESLFYLNKTIDSLKKLKNNKNSDYSINYDKMILELEKIKIKLKNAKPAAEPYQ